VTSAGILASFAVRVKFESDAALALVTAESVDALVFASVIRRRAFVVFFHEAGGEPGLLHAAVADEFDVKLVGVALDVVGDLVAAKLADERGSFAVPVADFEVIVDAAIMVLYFERLKFQGDGEGFRDGDLPHALFVRSIIIGIIGTAQLAAFHQNLTAASGFVLGFESGAVGGARGAIFDPHATSG